MCLDPGSQHMSSPDRECYVMEGRQSLMMIGNATQSRIQRAGLLSSTDLELYVVLFHGIQVHS